ncbi:heparin lyase I family protein [Undibacterium sp. TS12]|uniref:heparin lyase I family protein n=1 Tax=Undibacterium sp. TS12 TaxID=2908202 RepID=UPI001F4D0151|nr:heparin lyase I family protein [Undibacterium sp. TS12]MCH8621999.1 polysaccharide lyase [Undibacterium sp. TS12]
MVIAGPVAGSGVYGNSLCLKPSASDVGASYQFIEDIFGKGAVEAPSDVFYQPRRPHVAVLGDADVPAYFAILAIEPSDVNLDLRSQADGGDRSRTEIKIAPAKTGMHVAFQAHEGDTYTYAWRFKIAADMKFSPSFTHVHQIKAHGGRFAEAPLITFTALANGMMEIRHIADQSSDGSAYQVLAKVPLAQVQGQWISVRERIRFANHDSAYQLNLDDQKGQSLLQLQRNDLQLWRTGADHMRPKWGIYRKHHVQLNQHRDDYVYFADLSITRSDDKPTCP